MALGYDDLAYFHQNVWGYSALNFSSAALVFCALENATVSRLLSFRPLAFVGMISFGVYVWHLPLMRVAAMVWPAEPHSIVGLVRFAVYFVVTIAVATLSYFGFERYFLRLKKRAYKAESISPRRASMAPPFAGPVLNAGNSPALEGNPRKDT
jgi:peptidoglycan/LPS O-acetylase OafA/YrhL